MGDYAVSILSLSTVTATPVSLSLLAVTVSVHCALCLSLPLSVCSHYSVTVHCHCHTTVPPTINIAVHCPLSTVHCPLSLLPLPALCSHYPVTVYCHCHTSVCRHQYCTPLSLLAVTVTPPPLGTHCRAAMQRVHRRGSQRVHRRGSQVLSECCKVRYPATLARVHVHRFISSENRGLRSLGDRCREFIAKDHRYYLNVIK